jgi:hypothetical protein
MTENQEIERQIEREVVSFYEKKARGERPTLAEHEAVWDKYLSEGIREGGRRAKARMGQGPRRREREQKAMLAALPIAGMARA